MKMASQELRSSRRNGQWHSRTANLQRHFPRIINIWLERSGILPLPVTIEYVKIAYRNRSFTTNILHVAASVVSAAQKIPLLRSFHLQGFYIISGYSAISLPFSGSPRAASYAIILAPPIRAPPAYAHESFMTDYPGESWGLPPIATFPLRPHLWSTCYVCFKQHYHVLLDARKSSNTAMLGSKSTHDFSRSDLVICFTFKLCALDTTQLDNIDYCNYPQGVLRVSLG